MENRIDSKILIPEVITLTSGINAYFAEQYDKWEHKTKCWVAAKWEELLPAGDRERLVDEINIDTPHQLLQQLSDEWPVEEGVIESFTIDIKAKVEELKEKFGVEPAIEIMDETIKWLRVKAAKLGCVEFEMSIRTLNWLYEDAKEVTIMEFLTRSNYKDVLEYHEELRRKLWEMHYEAIEWHEAKILSEVATAMEKIKRSIDA